jgi:hypothetical protein
MSGLVQEHIRGLVQDPQTLLCKTHTHFSARYTNPTPLNPRIIRTIHKSTSSKHAKVSPQNININTHKIKKYKHKQLTDLGRHGRRL